MALEPIGNSVGIEKLKEKLKKRFPNHNFDIPSEPDTRCKAPSMCKNNKIFYTDSEGNKYCGQRFKLQHPKISHSWEWSTCHALVEKKKEKDNAQELPF